MHDTKLNKLASDYADGVLDFYSYRKKRALFINNLIKENDSDDTLQPIKSRKNECKAQIKYKKCGIENSSYKNKAKLSFFCATALIAIGMSVFYLLNDVNPSKESPIITDENKDIIENSLFLAAKKLQDNSSWSTDYTNTFYNAWNQASSDERTAFSESIYYQQLAYSIEQELMLLKSVGGSSGRVDDNLDTIKKIAGFFGIDVDQHIVQSEVSSDNSYSIELEKKKNETKPSTALKKTHIERNIPTKKTHNQKDTSINKQTKTTKQPTEITIKLTKLTQNEFSKNQQITSKESATETAKKNSRGCDKVPARICFDTIKGEIRGPIMVRIFSKKPVKFGSKHKLEEQPDAYLPPPNYKFAISETEISFQQYRYYCKHTGCKAPISPWNNDKLPVVNVSWYDAKAYTDWLTAVTGNQYRLPTEFEWEMSARAGTETPYSFGNKILQHQAHYSDANNAHKKPVEVKSKGKYRNPYKLYHMVGNIREWVEDHWKDNHQNTITTKTLTALGPSKMRTVKGGSYADVADNVRSASRVPLFAITKDLMTGFRVALIFNGKE